MPSSKPGSLIPSGSSLSQAQLARARGHSYRLFSQLFLQGITAVSLPYLQKIPELSAVLPSPFNAAAAAAEHHDLFRFNVFAHESFFLGEDGLVGGEKTAVVNQRYAELGCTMAAADTQADHLGHELACLAFLVSQEADVWETDFPKLANELQARQRAFMRDHLLCWAPACLLAIQVQQKPLFTELARLTLDLLLAHYENLSETDVEPPSNFPTPTQNILADDKTGFREIARYLLLPALSGIYLSRDNIGQLGRQFELPRGFGSREMMLLNLLRTAVQYDALPLLLAALQGTCQEWQTSYQELANEHPQAVPFLHPWQDRAAATEQMVIELMASSSIMD